jgi:hypothetical protein
VYGAIDDFVVELQEAIDASGADTTIVRTPANALIQLERLKIDGALVNHHP